MSDTANVTAAGALMDSEVTDLAGIKSVTISTLQVKPSEGAFVDGDKTKLDGIATNAEVNVQSDWNETDSGADAYIQNKPTIPSGNQIIDWTVNNATYDIHSDNIPTLNQNTTGTAGGLSSSSDITIDSATDVIIDAGGGNIVLKDDVTTFGSFVNSSSSLLIRSGTNNAITFSGVNGTYAGSITCKSSISATGDITAYSSSDRRYKDNLVRISEPNEKIKKINGYEFDWNEKHEQYKNTHDVGVVAQEIEEVLPEIVTERDDGYKAVKYERIVALLIESNKDLLRRVEELEELVKNK